MFTRYRRLLIWPPPNPNINTQNSLTLFNEGVTKGGNQALAILWCTQ